MNACPARYFIPLLRWTLGLMVILEPWRFYSRSADHFLVEAGLPSGIRSGLAEWRSSPRFYSSYQ